MHKRQFFIATGALGLVAASCVDRDPGSDRQERIGSVSQAVTTGPGCVEIRRGGAGNAWDTDFSEANGNWAAGTYSGGTWTGGTGGVTSLHYAAFKFDLSAVPSDANVTTATFRVYTGWNSASSTVRAHAMAVDWVEATATFASVGGAAGYSAPVLGSFNPVWGSDGFRTLDLSALTKAWLGGSEPNRGIALEEDLGKLHNYFVSESSTLARRPSLTVCWDGPIDVDHCAGNPCQNSGACVDGETDYTCQCTGGWTGTDCDVPPDVDECEASPCVNGDCVDQLNAYECLCNPGWTGANCDIEVDECAANPCVHGNCVDQLNAYECFCNPGWTGTNCETPACVPTTCAAEGAACGTIPNGCGGTLDCGTCAAACPCEALPGWGLPPGNNPVCINYSGFFGPNSVYYYLKDDLNGPAGPAVVFQVDGQFGREPDLCGAQNASNTGTFLSLTSQAQADACVQSLVALAASGGVSCN